MLVTLQAGISAAALLMGVVAAVVLWVRRRVRGVPPVTAEELERAEMRSLSWPDAD